MEKVNLTSDKFSDSTYWDSGKFSFEKDRTCGISWPQRNYRCSFCKKEFKSAQALGGHMNVHRRDRAKMRDSLNIYPNPNFSSSSSPPSVPKFLPFMTRRSSLTGISSSSSASTDEEKVNLVSHSQRDHLVIKRNNVGKNMNKRALLELREPPVVTKRNDYSRVWDLNTGSLGKAEDDLDLELRLGLS